MWRQLRATAIGNLHTAAKNTAACIALGNRRRAHTALDEWLTSIAVQKWAERHASGSTATDVVATAAGKAAAAAAWSSVMEKFGFTAVNVSHKVKEMVRPQV